MSKTVVLRSADVQVYINGEKYSEIQKIQYTIDYGEQEIFGIDQIAPQEIAVTKMTVQGTISGVRVKYSGGLQGKGVRPKILDSLSAPYMSLRITDRSNGEDIIYIPSTKVTSESFSAVAKGVASVSFKFKGILALNPLDRNG